MWWPSMTDKSPSTCSNGPSMGNHIEAKGIHSKTVISRKLLPWLRQNCTLHRLAWALITISLCTSIALIFRTSSQRITIVDSTEVLTRVRANRLHPILLLWTPVWGETIDQQKDLKELRCFGSPISCEISDNRHILAESAALIFHARDVSLQDLPNRKYVGQPWVLWNQEAPHNTPMDVYAEGRNLFDLELSYRRTADIFAPYGYIAEHERGAIGVEEDLKELKVRFYTQVGAVWLASDCSTESQREDYVNELKEYFPVDVYGDCGNHVCSKSSNDSCMADFSRKYMFFLAFENSLCPDYVTEKLYRTLQYPIIPVVLSGSRDSFLDSMHAFVDASNIPPLALALKMQEISRNFTAYAEYFAWKTNYSAHSQWHPVCHICEAVQRNLRTPSMLSVKNESLIDLLKYNACKQWNGDSRTFVPLGES